ALDGQIVDIIAEIDRDGLWGGTGARTVAGLVAWKLGVSPAHAKTLTAVAQRREEFPRCTAGMREGRVSLDQVGVIAEHAATGSDAHYAELAVSATVNQLRTALKMEPKPQPQPDAEPDPAAEPGPGPDADPAAEPQPGPQPQPQSQPEPRLEPARSISKTCDEDSTTWHITLPHDEAATFDAALASHQDAVVAEWKRNHPDGPSETTPPFPNPVDGFISLIHAGWDTDVAARPHGQRTTIVVHLDVEKRIGALHLGPVLTDEDRQYLTCDATREVWFERAGQPIGAGRETRTISRRLRRALENRDRCCVVPGCSATRGLHAHHLQHWENGGPTELSNPVPVCRRSGLANLSTVQTYGAPCHIRCSWTAWYTVRTVG
ncbi:MAG: HNH endonuclease signature motif containing protein, partial [Mycobacterium sp.]